MVGEEGEKWGGLNVPAPVVPPPRVEERMVGDWWIVRSRPAMARSIEVADWSTKPKFWEGMGWEKRRKDSGGGSGC